jgi:hypothetical protein
MSEISEEEDARISRVLVVSYVRSLFRRNAAEAACEQIITPLVALSVAAELITIPKAYHFRALTV